MAKTKKGKATDARDHSAGSVATDRFWPCPTTILDPRTMQAASIVHPGMLIACRIMRGPKAHHVECGACGTRTILAPRFWKESYGMSGSQAQALGFVVLA